MVNSEEGDRMQKIYVFLLRDKYIWLTYFFIDVLDSLPSHGSYNFLFSTRLLHWRANVGLVTSIGYAAPSLQSHYRAFFTTTNDSAPDWWHRYLGSVKK